MTPKAYLVALLAAALLATSAPTAQAEMPVPIELGVIGGGDHWHAQPVGIYWSRLGPAPAAVGFAIYDIGGNRVVTERIRGSQQQIEPLPLPGPGWYGLELWLEDAAGNRGPTAEVGIPYDPTPPPPVHLAPTPPWIGGRAPTFVRIEHPDGALPVSGIRGYALSVEQGSGTLPCGGRPLCGLSETTLNGGIGGDLAPLGILPEGDSTIHVVAVSGAGVRSTAISSTVVHVDAGLPRVRLEGLPTGWAGGPVNVVAKASDGLSGMVAAGPEGPFTALRIDGEVPLRTDGDEARGLVSGEGEHTVAAFARDAAGNERPPSAPDSPFPTATVRIDETPPEITFARAQDPDEPERIEATVTDALAGPDRSRGTIGVRQAGDSGSYTALPTVFAGGRLVARWDSDAFPQGSYEFHAVAYDAAGNAGDGERRLGGGRMVLVNPLKTPTEVRAGFGGRELRWHRCHRHAGGRRCRGEVVDSFARRPKTRAIPYAHATWYGGRVVLAGQPLAGARVEVVESFDPGTEESPRTTVVATDADGVFLTRLAAGPSRQVQAVFPGTATLTRSLGPGARLDVRAGVSLHASTTSVHVGGAPVVFSGRVGALGSPLPREGLPVQLQFKLPRHPWTEFRTIQCDRRGRFRYAYSFSDDDSRGVRFQFRAHLAAAGGWPYAPGTSRPLAVTGS